MFWFYRKAVYQCWLVDFPVLTQLRAYTCVTCSAYLTKKIVSQCPHRTFKQRVNQRSSAWTITLQRSHRRSEWNRGSESYLSIIKEYKLSKQYLKSWLWSCNYVTRYLSSVYKIIRERSFNFKGVHVIFLKKYILISILLGKNWSRRWQKRTFLNPDSPHTLKC